MTNGKRTQKNALRDGRPPACYASFVTLAFASVDPIAAENALRIIEEETARSLSCAMNCKRGEAKDTLVPVADLVGEMIRRARDFRDTLAVGVEKSVTKHPYTTLALSVRLGFLFGATWRR